MSLVDRALEFLKAAGGSASTDDLARFLFRAGGSQWSQVLATSLQDSRITFDGTRWRVVQPEQGEERVAFAIERTGQDPARHAVVSLAACRFGPRGATFHSIVRPDRRIPGWLVERLAIDASLIDESPALADVIGPFRDFLGDSTLVGYDALRQIEFLNYRLRWAGLAPIENEVMDLFPAVAERFGTAKPGIERAARSLGIPVGRRHYGANEALLVAAIASKLTVAPTADADRDPLRSAAEHAPDRPGVYRFLDDRGETLYVGKAISLRRRLRSYLARPAEHDRGLSGLRTLTHRVQVEELADDLAATLREAELVSSLQPRFNSQRQVQPAATYLALDRSEPFPRIRKQRDPGPDQFGPFPSDRAASRLAAQATAVFPLRVCTRKLGRVVKKRRPPCELLEAGRCLGPCTGTVDPQRYDRVVAEASAFLAGDRVSATRWLRTDIQRAAARADFAEVNRMRDLLRELTMSSPVERLGRPYDPANVAVYVPAGNPPHIYLIVAGLVRFAGPRQVLEERGAEAIVRDKPVAASGATLVARWLRTNQRRAVVLPVDPGDEPTTIVRKLLALLDPPLFDGEVEPVDGRLTV